MVSGLSFHEEITGKRIEVNGKTDIALHTVKSVLNTGEAEVLVAIDARPVKRGLPSSSSWPDSRG